MANPVLSLVKINNVDVGTVLFSWDQNPLLGEKVKSIAIELHRNVYDLVPELETSPTGITVTVQRGAVSSTEEFVFNGTVIERNTIGSRVTIKCNDKLYLAVQSNITKTFNKNIDTEAGKISEIFKTLCTTAGLSTSSSSVQDSGNVILLDTFICNNADVFERMERLAELLDWQFYYKPSDDLIYFEPKGTRSGADVLEVGVNVLNRPVWKADGSKIIKDIKFFGGPVQTGTTNSFTASASQDEFGLSEIATNVRVTVDGTEQLGGLEGQSINADYFLDAPNKLITWASVFSGGEAVVIEIQFLSPLTITASNPVTSGLDSRLDKEDITNLLDGENYVNTLMSRHAQEFKSTTLSVTNTQDLEVGQTQLIIDSNEGVNSSFIITRLRKRFPYAFDQISISNEPLQIEEWSISIDDRIKRIEEKLAQEETLVIFLRPGNRTIKIGREYAKLEKRDISGDTLIWDNPTFGTWDAQNWGETLPGTDTLNQLIQGGGVYVEDFLDDDFEGAGTASWSNTGSVTFTSGQNALSSTVEFNNGTITRATLTSAEVSGSFTYELSTDGGSNFETVTSGVPHTFTNTGIDLRWKATENSASTGEISEIKLSDFH